MPDVSHSVLKVQDYLEYILKIWSTDLVLVHSNHYKKSYRQNLRFFHTFVLNKTFGQFLEILPKRFICLNTFNLEFVYDDVWFTNQNYKSLEIEDKINLTLIINWYVTYKKSDVFQFNIEMHFCERI